MGVPTLILLGAAGGVLRGVLDFYIQFMNWRSARGAHLREQLPESEKPRFRQYFDPAVDLTAAGVHSGMGAALAVLFGSTGQISGPYAAIVVGISAPVMLTQLARIHTVSDALGGGQQAAGPVAGAADPLQQVVPAPLQPASGEPGTGMVGGAPVASLAGGASSAVASATLQPDGETGEPRPAASSTRAEAFQPGAGTPLPPQSDTEAVQPRAASSHLRSAAFRPDADTAQPQPHPHPQPNGRPTDSAAGPGRGRGDRGTPPLRGEPAIGEEG